MLICYKAERYDADGLRAGRRIAGWLGILFPPKDLDRLRKTSRFAGRFSVELYKVLEYYKTVVFL